MCYYFIQLSSLQYKYFCGSSTKKNAISFQHFSLMSLWIFFFWCALPSIKLRQINLLPAMNYIDTWRLQMEVVLNFLTGSLDMSETYCDDFRLIAARYIAAPHGFWFDCATSLPWSLNDLLAYQVTYLAWFLLSDLICNINKHME